MKKLLLATTLSLAVTAPAFASHSGFYVQGDLGWASISDDYDENADGFAQRATLGYNFGNNWRMGLDYTHYNDYDGSEAEYDYTYGNKFHSFGLSAIYDFNNVNFALKPYLGARVAVNHWKHTDSEEGYEYSSSETKTGVGVLTGVNYEITPDLDLDVGYRYNYWGKFAGDTKLDSHEVMAGLRYTF